MPKAEEKPQAEGLERLYISESAITIKVLGVEFTLRDISGEEFFELAKGCMGADGRTVIPEKYIPKLIDATVISPKVEVSKLNVKAYTMLAAEIQKALGLAELVPKNLNVG